MRKNVELQEEIIRVASAPRDELATGVSFRLLASKEVGSEGFSTALATFAPLASLPYHFHEYSEAVTVISGNAAISVEGRTYHLRPLDCIHIPGMVAHSSVNSSSGEELKVLNAFAHATPRRHLVVGGTFSSVDLGSDDPPPGATEYIRRYAKADKYELAAGTSFYDLFAGRFGAKGICGGYAEFAPGTSLPCHVHNFGESITIITGVARCEVMGNSHLLKGCDTAFVPKGRPHRFLNESTETMAMIWVYAGDEPTRTLVDTEYCDGTRQRRS
jgi:quercetin dioxygenase-like cupin family protein